MKRVLIGLSVLSAAAAFGQSINVDMNVTSGAGAGAPASGFRGAAGVAGGWNALGSSSGYTLVDINGNLGPVTLTRSGGGTMTSHSTGALTGDFERLLEDGFRGSTGVTLTYTFANLSAGTYALYTYAIDPTSMVPSIVNVAGSTSRTDQSVGSIGCQTA